MNNAIIGFGGSTEDVSNAVRQLSQDISGGRLQAETWNSLLDSGLGPTLAAIARQMGKTTKELKDGLSDGSVSVATFTDSLIGMNEKGGGGLKSLEQISRDATKGIGTGWANLNTAITRGIASFIKAIGPENISGAISNFGASLEGALKSLSLFIPTIINNLARVGDYLGPKLATLGATIREDVIPAISNFAKAFGPAVGAGLVGAIGLTIDGLNLLMAVATPVINYLSENTWVIWALVGAFAAWKAALVIESVATSFKAAMALVNGSILITSGTATTATGVMGGLRAALVLLANPWILTLTIAGVAGVLASIEQIRGALEKLTKGFKDLSTQKINVGGKEVGGTSDLGLTAQIRNAFGGMLRASGGPVSAGHPYIVGEEGPELFTPRSAGNILPNDETMGMSSGSNSSPTVINLHMDGIMARSRADLRDIGKDIIRSINEELVAKSKTPIGGGAI